MYGQTKRVYLLALPYTNLFRDTLHISAEPSLQSSPVQHSNPLTMAGSSQSDHVGGQATNGAKVPDNAPSGCPGVDADTAGKEASCVGCPNQAACASGEAAKPDPDIAAIAARLGAPVRHKILVLRYDGCDFRAEEARGVVAGCVWG